MMKPSRGISGCGALAGSTLDEVVAVLRLPSFRLAPRFGRRVRRRPSGRALRLEGWPSTKTCSSQASASAPAFFTSAVCWVFCSSCERTGWSAPDFLRLRLRQRLPRLRPSERLLPSLADAVGAVLDGASEVPCETPTACGALGAFCLSKPVGWLPPDGWPVARLSSPPPSPPRFEDGFRLRGRHLLPLLLELALRAGPVWPVPSDPAPLGALSPDEVSDTDHTSANLPPVTLRILCVAHRFKKGRVLHCPK